MAQDMEAGVVAIEVKRPPRKIFQCYKREWEKLPIFKEWLTPVPGNRHKAYCKFCRKQFRAHRTDLRSHARSRKHQKAGDLYFSNSATNVEPCPVAMYLKKEMQNNASAGRSEGVTITDELEEDENVDFEESYETTENHEEDEEIDNTNVEQISESKEDEDLMERGWKARSLVKRKDSLEPVPVVALGRDSEGSASAKGISTQVLDLVLGAPVSRLSVALLMECGSIWSKISEGVTDGRGRCMLLKPQEVVQGRYKLNYDVKKYFTLGLHDTIYPFIEVTFDITDLQDDYHVPLLLSPCGYMVYRIR